MILNQLGRYDKNECYPIVNDRTSTELVLVDIPLVGRLCSPSHLFCDIEVGVDTFGLNEWLHNVI